MNEATKSSYMLMEDDEVAYDMSTLEDDEESTEETDSPKIEKLEGTEKILGYTCHQYKMTITEDSSTTIMYYWVTEE